MREWGIGFWAFISLMLTAIALSFLAMLGSLGQQAAKLIDEDEANIARMQEYRKYNQYDNTLLRSQDVITAILETRGMPWILVDTLEGPREDYGWAWSESSPADTFSTTFLSQLFPVDAIYLATIEKNANGEIAILRFRRE